MRAGAVAAALLVAACGQRTTISAAWTDGPLIAFGFSQDEKSVLSELGTGAFIIGGDDPLAVQIQSDSTLILAGFDPEELRERHPSFDSSQPELLRLDLEQTDCAEGRADPSFSELSVPLERPALRVLSVSEEGGLEELAEGTISALDAVTLRGPALASFCKLSEGGSMSAFGSTLELLPNEEPGVGQLSFVTRLDADRVVAGASRNVYLIDRNGSIERTPARLITPEDAGHPLIEFDAIAKRVGHPTQLVLVGSRQVVKMGSIARVVVGPDGFESVTTSTITSLPLREVVYGESGEVVAIGDIGLVLAAPSAEGPFRAARTPRQIDLFSIALTGDPTQPHAITTRDGSFWLGDALAPGSGAFVEERTGIVGSLTGLVIRPVEGGFQAWVGTEDGALLVRETDGTWRQVDYGLQDAANGCADSRVDECGARLVSDKLAEARLLMGADLDRLFFTVQHCSGIFTVPIGALCAEMLAVEGDMLGRRIDDGLIALSLEDGYLTAVGHEGRIAELKLD